MSTKTQNYQLLKPDLSDSADIRTYHNANMDSIDLELNRLNTNKLNISDSYKEI